MKELVENSIDAGATIIGMHIVIWRLPALLRGFILGHVAPIQYENIQRRYADQTISKLQMCASKIKAWT